MQNPAYNLRRIASYLLGFVLFYEPFMLFNQLASTFFVDTSFSSIHVPCTGKHRHRRLAVRKPHFAFLLSAVGCKLAVARPAVLRQALSCWSLQRIFRQPAAR